MCMMFSKCKKMHIFPSLVRILALLIVLLPNQQLSSAILSKLMSFSNVHTLRLPAVPKYFIVKKRDFDSCLQGEEVEKLLLDYIEILNSSKQEI